MPGARQDISATFGTKLPGAAGYVAVFTGLAAAMTLIMAWVAVAGGLGGRLANSDQVYTFLLMRDLFDNPASLASWHLPPAAFIFPDWPIAGLVTTLPLPNPLHPLLYGGILLAGHAMAVAALLRAGRLARPAAAIALAATILLPLLIAIALTPYRSRISTTIFNIALPSFHSGAILIGLALAACVVSLIYRPTNGTLFRSPRGLLLCALAAMGCFSDLFFVVWFVVPAAITCLIVAANGSGGEAIQARSVLRLLLGVSAASIAAQILVLGFPTAHLTNALRPAGHSFQVMDIVSIVLRPSLFVLFEPVSLCGPPLGALFGCTPSPHAADILARLVGEALRKGDWLALASLCAALATGIRAALLCARLMSGKRPSAADSAEILLAGAAWGALIVVVTVNIPQKDPRYLIPFFTLPFIGILFAVLRLAPSFLRDRTAFTAAWLACAAIWAGTAIALAPSMAATLKRLDTPSPLAACLLKSGKTAGIGDYWSAKEVMFLTEYRIHMVQITDRGTQYLWVYNTDWFKTHIGDKRPLAPTFIVLRNLDPAMVRANFGAPDRIEQCGRNTIWHYDKTLPLPLPPTP